MTFADWLVTIAVLLGVFLLFYCAIRQQGIKETLEEIKEIIKGRADEAKEKIVYA